MKLIRNLKIFLPQQLFGNSRWTAEKHRTLQIYICLGLYGFTIFLAIITMGMFWAKINQTQDANLITISKTNKWLDYGLEVIDRPLVGKFKRFIEYGMSILDNECLRGSRGGYRGPGYNNDTKPAHCLGVDIPDQPSTSTSRYG